MTRFADGSDRYRLDSHIATGGMGEVWRGTDTLLNRVVAVKILKPEFAGDASFRTRFETEARNAAALHHPAVCAVFDFGEGRATTPGGPAAPFLVMEFVDGQPLSDLLRPGSPMDPDACRQLLAEAADGLAVAHAAGIVHRDMKPANLILTRDRHVKVTDFGIARALEAMALTQTGQVMGTPQYLSPEQAQGLRAGPASDVYSLGVVAYECLAGRRPFQAETPVATALAHVREQPPALPDDVPPSLAAVVMRALEKDPDRRFADAAEFARALRDPASVGPAAAVAAPAATSALPPASAGGPDSTQVMPSIGMPLAPAPDATTATPAAGAKQRSSAWLWVLAAVVLVVLIGLASFLLLDGTGGDSDDDDPTRVPPTTETSEPSEPTTSDTPPTTPTTEPTTPQTTPPTTPTTEPTTPQTTPPTTTLPTSEPPTSDPTTEGDEQRGDGDDQPTGAEEEEQE